MNTVAYRCITTRPDGSTYTRYNTLELPYGYNGQTYDLRNVGELIAKWNAEGQGEYAGRLINRYEYALVDEIPTS